MNINTKNVSIKINDNFDKGFEGIWDTHAILVHWVLQKVRYFLFKLITNNSSEYEI